MKPHPISFLFFLVFFMFLIGAGVSLWNAQLWPACLRCLGALLFAFMGVLTDEAAAKRRKQP